MLDLLPLGSFPLIQIPLVKGSYENILDFLKICCEKSTPKDSGNLSYENELNELLH
jgi:hypothetical protein